MEETKRLYSMPYFRVWWEAKIHSAKWIHSVHNMGCWKKSASMWGSGRRGGKNEVLYYKARHWSQILVLSSSAECGNSTDCRKTWTRGCDNIKSSLTHCRPLSFVRSTLWSSSGVLVFQQRQYRGNKHHIGLLSVTGGHMLARHTPALSQPSDRVNTEGKKRCSIVLQGLKGWPGIVTPCPSESSFLWPLNEHWWSSLARMWLQLFTQEYPPLTKEPGNPSV